MSDQKKDFPASIKDELDKKQKEFFDKFIEDMNLTLENENELFKKTNGCPRCGSKGIHTCRIKDEG